MSYPESDYLKFIMYILMIMLFKFVFNFIHRRQCYKYKTYWEWTAANLGQR